MLGEGFHGGFGSVVCWVSWGIGDSLFRTSYEDGAGMGGGAVGCYEGEEGGEAVDYAKEVYVHYFVEIVGIRPGAAQADSCVEGEEVNLAFLSTLSA